MFKYKVIAFRKAEEKSEIEKFNQISKSILFMIYV